MGFRKATLALLLVLTLFFVSFPKIKVEAQAKTIVVPDDFPTIQEAIDAASDGDTVFVKNGIYTDPVTIDKQNLSLIGEDKQNTIIELPYAKYMPRAVILVSGDNVTVSGFTIRNSLKSTGIILEIIGLNRPSPHPFGCRIIGNNIINNVGGIHSYYGSNLIISENNITGNGSHGIYQSSSNSTILDNNIINNAHTGIIVDSCTNVTIKENNITGNGLSGTSGVGGLYLRWDGPFYVIGNNISGNKAGIQFGYGCNNSTIHENNIERNVIGVELRNFDLGDRGLGTGNVVHGNNFIENSQQALVNKEYVYNFTFHEDDPTFSNGTDIVSWDNGTTGNYWSNYNGTDNNGDGIGDIPYFIDENNQDHRPLMISWQLFQELALWSIKTIDTMGSLHGGISMAVDSNNNPHIFYVTLTSSDPGPDDAYMVYTRWNGIEWISQRVISNGWGAALALDSDDKPHICYTYDDELIYATWNGSDWNSQNLGPVEHNWYSFTLDSNNNPHIIYALENRLMYASLLDSTWNIQTVDSSQDGFVYIYLVLDNEDNPHVIYYDHTGQVGYGSGSTRYAYWNGSAWDIQVAFPGISSVKSLAVDSKGYPHVSYSTNVDLFYASWDGSSWNSQNLSVRAFDGGYLALDNDENPHICYNDDEVFGYVSWNGTSWEYQIIDMISGMFGEEHLVLDAYDNPHLCYFETSHRLYGNLRYATLTDKKTKPDEPEIPSEGPWVVGNFFPEPNSVDVSLDTNISISFSRPPGIVELSIVPEVSIAKRTDDSWGLFGALYTFYFSRLLDPSTTYTVTVIYGNPNSTRSWSFTTTNEIPQIPSTPKDDSQDLSTYYLLLIFVVIISGVIIGLYLSRIREKTKQEQNERLK